MGPPFASIHGGDSASRTIVRILGIPRGEVCARETGDLQGSLFRKVLQRSSFVNLHKPAQNGSLRPYAATVPEAMNGALTRLRLIIDERKWVLWVAIAAVLVVAWFVLVALLPHHVVDTLKRYEEQPNGLREYPHGVRETPGG